MFLYCGQPCVLLTKAYHFCGKITLSKISARNIYETMLSAYKQSANNIELIETQCSLICGKDTLSICATCL